MRNNQQMRDFVITMLSHNLPKNYYYHNFEHTLYVVEKAREIGLHENCTQEELELLNVAALWHDTGYLKTYYDHEAESCLFARLYLPEYDYSPTEIERVCTLIMATKIPQTAKNKLAEILADADLEYLGTPSFETRSDNLFREMKSVNPSLTLEKWNQMQITFLQKHHYFTRFCIENREPVKQGYLNKLIQSTL